MGIWEFVAIVVAVITIQLVPPVVVGLLLAKRTPAHVGKAPLHHRHYLLPEASSANLGFKCVLVASHAQTARLRIANARISTSLAILLVEPHVRIMDLLRVVGIAHAACVECAKTNCGWGWICNVTMAQRCGGLTCSGRLCRQCVQHHESTMKLANCTKRHTDAFCA